MNQLRLTEAMKQYNKGFTKGSVNLVNAPPASGKSYFISNEFINNTNQYYKTQLNYNKRLSKILYICDTSMLKESIQAESKDNIKIKGFGKGSIIEAKNFNNLKQILSEDNGAIKIMTYNHLGLLLKNKQCKSMIVEYFNVIIADELQNLFNYCSRYDTELNENNERVFKTGNYITLIECLNELSSELLFIGLSGTDNDIHNFIKTNKMNINIKYIFTDEERKTIYTHNFNPQYTNCIMNYLKTCNYTKIKELNFKMLICTNTIKESINFKNYLLNEGLKAEWLCSTNNKKYPMSEYQLYIKNRLLYGEGKATEDKERTKGTLPDNLDVLIINGGYETGWNLHDERVQICVINITKHSIQYQFRHRIRHDIKQLICLCALYDDEGYKLTYGQYGELVKDEIQVTHSKYYYIPVYKYNMKDINNKYLGIKLTKELKQELILKYALKDYKDKVVNWKTLKRDLISLGYEVKTTGRGTYIYNNKVKENKEMCNSNIELVEYLEDLVGKRLYKDEQQKLINKISLKDSRNRLQKSIKTINAYLEENFNKSIINKQVKVNNTKITVWIITDL